MPFDLKFDSQILESLVGGLPALESYRLNVQSLGEATEFIQAYGFDCENEDELNQLWAYHCRAVTYIREELLETGEEFPEVLSDPNQLKDLRYILIYASTKDQKRNSLHTWSCAVLKVMHVLVHLDNDLFTRFSSEIQEEVLRPIQSHVYNDPISGIWLGSSTSKDRISLKKFDIKAFKSSNSSVTKLLAKPEAVAFTLLDKVGVRFVTKHLFDAFRVLRYLTENNLVSFPHNIPDQSNNTLYPTNLFLETMEGFTRGQDITEDQIDKALLEKLAIHQDQAKYNLKYNPFTSSNYRFIKFITRRLVKIQSSEKPIKFFYPFEVQIVDYETYLKNLSGDASHEKYKVRQKSRARSRVLGIDLESSKKEL